MSIKLQSQKASVTQALNLAKELMQKPNDQFQYRCQTLTRIINDAAEGCRFFRGAGLYFKLKSVLQKVLPTVQQQGSWTTSQQQEIIATIELILERLKVVAQYHPPL